MEEQQTQVALQRSHMKKQLADQRKRSDNRALASILTGLSPNPSISLSVWWVNCGKRLIGSGFRLG